MLHDYRCETCGNILRDQYRTAAQGAQSNLPRCSYCERPMIWIPQTRAMDVGGVKGAAFRAFETRDGRNQPVLVDSLHKLRQIERESEQQARNGEGQQMTWRQYSQDPSNKHVHTLMKDPTPTITGRTRRGVPLVRETLRPSESGEPEVTMGDGVVGVSPLPMEPGG